VFPRAGKAAADKFGVKARDTLGHGCDRP
jgi:hypothetical protein